MPSREGFQSLKHLCRGQRLYQYVSPTSGYLGISPGTEASRSEILELTVTFISSSARDRL